MPNKKTPLLHIGLVGVNRFEAWLSIHLSHVSSVAQSYSLAHYNCKRNRSFLLKGNGKCCLSFYSVDTIITSAL